MDLGKVIGSNSTNYSSKNTSRSASLLQNSQLSSFKSALLYAGEKMNFYSNDTGINTTNKYDSVQAKKEMYSSHSDNNINKPKYDKKDEVYRKDDSDVQKTTDDDDAKAKKSQKKDEVKEKLDKIKKLLSDPDLQNDVKKQDELMKLMLQLQSMVDGSAADLGNGLMAQINDLLNSPVLQTMSVQDSLMKDVVKDIKSQIDLAQNAKIEKESNDEEESVEVTDLSSEIASSIQPKTNQQNGNDQVKEVSPKEEASLRKDTISKVASSQVTDADDVAKDVNIASSSDNRHALAMEQTILSNDVKPVNTESKTDSLKKSEESKSTLPELSLRQEAKLRLQSGNANNHQEGQYSEDQNSMSNGNAYGNAVNQSKSAERGFQSNILFSDELIQKAQSNKTGEENALKEMINNNVEVVESSSKGTSPKEAFRSLSSNPIEATSQNGELTSANGLVNTRLDQQLNVNRNNTVPKQTNPLINYKDVIEQVTKGTKVMVSESVSEMTIKMNPENLGKLSLKLVTENGIITAKFVAESQQVKEIIESSFNELKQSFANQGLNLANVDVSVGSGSHESARQQMFNNSKTRRKYRDVSDSDKVEGITGDANYLEEDSKINYRYPESSVEYTV